MDKMGRLWMDWKKIYRSCKITLASTVLTVGGGALSSWIAHSREKLYAAEITQMPFVLSERIFPMVGLILYGIMGVSVARIWLKPDTEMKKYALKTCFWQFVFSLVWRSRILVGHNDGLAFLWLLMLWVQVAWTISAFRQIDRLAAGLMIPYLIWLSLASCLYFCVIM